MRKSSSTQPCATKSPKSSGATLVEQVLHGEFVTQEFQDRYRTDPAVRTVKHPCFNRGERFQPVAYKPFSAVRRSNDNRPHSGRAEHRLLEIDGPAAGHDHSSVAALTFSVLPGDSVCTTREPPGIRVPLAIDARRQYLEGYLRQRLIASADARSKPMMKRSAALNPLISPPPDLPGISKLTTPSSVLTKLPNT